MNLARRANSRFWLRRLAGAAIGGRFAARYGLGYARRIAARSSARFAALPVPLLALASAPAAALVLALVGTLFPLDASAETLRIGGTGAALGTMRVLGEEFARRRPGDRVEVLSSIGSTGAIKSVDAGAIDLGLSGRPAKPAEEKLDARLHRYAVTPLIFAVHPGVGAHGLSRRELADIYAGRQLRWPNGGLIRLILRPATDSDNEVLRAVSPDLAPAIDQALARKGMRYAATDQDAADALEHTPGALGSSTLSLLISERRRFTPLAVDGVAPSVDTLRSGRYPFPKSLYLVSRSAPSPAVRAFIDLLRSPRGQEILIQNGQLPAKD